MRCTRAFARFHPPPPPPTGLSVDHSGATASPRHKGKPRTPPPPQPLSSTLRAGASSGITPPLSPARSAVTQGRTRAATKQSSSPLGRSGRRVLSADETDGTASHAIGVTPRNRAGKATVPQQSALTFSPKANKTGNDNGTSVSSRGGMSPSPRRRGKGRAEADFEAATAAMKSKFEEQPDDCMVMVVAVNGVRPQPPRAPRSLEGYCIVVSRTVSLALS